MRETPRNVDVLALVLATVIARTIERRRAECADRRAKLSVVDGKRGGQAA